MGLDLLLLFQHLLASDLEGHSKTELGRLLKFTYVVSFCQIRVEKYHVMKYSP